MRFIAVSELHFGGDLDDSEYPDPPDDDERQDTSVCPSCSSEVFEDAVQCPVCGEYVTHSTTVQPIWRWTAVGILLILVWYLLSVVLPA